jgi:tetratricopeptide (TPR) repeat protein
MDSIPFVGRQAELTKIKDYFNQALNKKGLIVFLEGEAGIGKSWFLEQFEKNHENYSNSENVRFLNGYCYEDISPNSAYQPFIEILNSISENNREGNFWQLFGGIVKETAPDWLKAVPVVGSLLSAGAKTITITNDLLRDDGNHGSKLDRMINQYANVINHLAENELLVMIIEDAHWIDNSSCSLLQRLSERIDNQKILLIVTYRYTEVSLNHPLANLKSRIINNTTGQIIRLSGLTHEEVEKYLQIRYKTTLNENMASWLTYLCHGNPLFISQYCNLLEQENVIVCDDSDYRLEGNIFKVDEKWQTDGLLSRIEVTQGIEALLFQRINRLLDEEQTLLELASVQGELFDSKLLASMSEQKESDILTKLRKISEKHSIIRLHNDDLEQDIKSELYEFEHMLMHRAFYKKLSPRERIIDHQQIANIIQKNLDPNSTPSRKQLLDISYHCAKGHQLIDSAKFSYQAAESSFNDGAIIECQNLCEETLGKLQSIAADNNFRDRLFAQTTLLFLNCSRPRNKSEQLRMLALSNQAVSAAQRAGDKITYSGLKARIGNLYIGLGNVPEALKHFKDALEAAKESEDSLTICNAMEVYGRDLAKVDLEEGLKIRREAYNLYKDKIRGKFQAVNTDFIISKVLISLGVGEFDVGNYSDSCKYISEGLNLMRALNFQKTTALIVPPLNYLAQVYLAMGLFELAEKTLTESITLIKQEERPDPWNGNNLALLGKLYIEWQKINIAEKPMLEGLEESEATQQVDLITLVRNYYGELLMHPEFQNYDLEKAEEILTTNLGECQLSGMHRSEVTALSLLSKLALHKKLNADAVNYGSQAVNILNKFGILPVVRNEEVYFNYYLALKANNNITQAQE